MFGVISLHSKSDILKKIPIFVFKKCTILILAWKKLNYFSSHAESILILALDMWWNFNLLLGGAIYSWCLMITLILKARSYGKHCMWQVTLRLKLERICQANTGATLTLLKMVNLILRKCTREPLSLRRNGTPRPYFQRCYAFSQTLKCVLAKWVLFRIVLRNSNIQLGFSGWRGFGVKS